MQQALFMHAFVSPLNIENGWWGYSLGRHSTEDDCCSWRNVRCTDGIATSTVLSQHDFSIFNAQIHMLPPTLMYLHITAARVRRFYERELPRELRYVFLTISVYNGPSESGETSHATQVFRTEDLPVHLEKAQIYVYTPLFHSIVIQRVPPSLQTLLIGCNTAIEYAYVDSRCLPDVLDRISMYVPSRSKKVKIVHTSSEKPDGRVETKNSRSGELSVRLNHTGYYACIDILEGISRDIFNERRKAL